MYKRALYFLIWLSTLTFPLVAQAADIIPNPNAGNNSRWVQQQGFRSGSSTIDTVFNALFSRTSRIFTDFYAILGALAVFALIYAGIQYITVAGNPDKSKKARQNIINVVLGVIILVASWGIITAFYTFSNYLASQSAH